jgi:hypothetical protein
MKSIALQRTTALGSLSITGIPIKDARYDTHSSVIDMENHELLEVLKSGLASLASAAVSGSL